MYTNLFIKLLKREITFNRLEEIIKGGETDIKPNETDIKPNETDIKPNETDIKPNETDIMNVVEKNDVKNIIRIKISCNWCSSKDLCTLWSKMSKDGKGSWGNIKLVYEDPCDYFLIINAPQPDFVYDKKKTILMRMEPRMHMFPQHWGEWANNPSDKDFLKVLKHESGAFNNNEWHLSWRYIDFITREIKKTKIFSTVLSSKYTDPGQVKRIDFVKYIERRMSLEGRMDIDVYGDNKWTYKNYKGSLPYHQKDEAIFPYKYTFNCENNSLPNYFTEKLIDGILGECLVFYSGCWNIFEYFDKRAFVYLELSNFENDFLIIQKAIEEDWHSQRLPFIKEAKKKILEEYQFFPRLENELKNLGKL